MAQDKKGDSLKEIAFEGFDTAWCVELVTIVDPKPASCVLSLEIIHVRIYIYIYAYVCMYVGMYVCIYM